MPLASRFEQALPVFERPIRSFARRRFTALPGTDPCELEQELLEVLWLCCTTYDPDKGAKFSTYFWTAAENRFKDLHKAASRKMRVGDYQRVWIDHEDLQVQVAIATQEPSAEDEAMAKINVREIYRSRPR